MHTYKDAVELLTSSGKFRISLGLERIKKILHLLDNPQDKLNCIHVAGTNGKGSVCSVISSILNQAGKKVGLYTSPHIFKYTERIKVSEQGELTDISDDDFVEYLYKINSLASENNIDLTEFEILTAIMFKFFFDKNVDIVVLETGLGGRYDATNVIKKNICSVITHIDYDHTERLGNTLDKIAHEKAGIIKPNCPCIVCEGKEVYYDTAKEMDAPLEIISPFISQEFANSSALKGTYQYENLSLALAVINKFFPEISSKIIKSGLENVKHPFRFQYIKDLDLIIDGAHNPNGIKALAESLDIYYPDKKRKFIFGCLKNKDYEKMANLLFSSNDKVYFYHFNHKNSCTFEDFKSICPVECEELKTKDQINFNDNYLNIICGSFYMISELTDMLDIRYYLN